MLKEDPRMTDEVLWGLLFVGTFPNPEAAGAVRHVTLTTRFPSRLERDYVSE